MADPMSSNDDFEQKLKELGYTDSAMQNAQNSAPTTEAENAALSATDTTDMDKLDAIRLQAAQAHPQTLPATTIPASTNLGAAEEQQRSQANFQPEFPEPAPGPQTSTPKPSSSPAATPMPAALTSQPSAPSDPLETNPELNDAALKEAQQKASLGTLFANLGSAGSSFAALAGGNKPEESYYENLAKQANAPVVNIEARRAAFEKNALVAGHMLDNATKRMNLNEQQQLNTAGTPATNLLKSIVENSHMKDSEGKPIDFKKIPGWAEATGNDVLQTQKVLSSAEHLQALRDQLTFRAGQADRKEVIQRDTKQGKALSDATNHLENYRGNRSVQNAAEALRNSDSAMALINSTNNYNDLTSPQVRMVTGELVKIAQGGAATQGGVKDASVHTLQSKVADWMQSLTGDPTGAQLGAFIQQNKDYLQHLNNVNHKYVDDYQSATLNGYKRSLHPEDYATLKNKLDEDKANRAPGQGNMPTSDNKTVTPPQATSQYKTGDTRQIGKLTYVRDANGNWSTQ